MLQAEENNQDNSKKAGKRREFKEKDSKKK